jgi:uncharacterized membrane protein
MRLSQLVITYVLSLVTFLALDFLWLGLVAKGFYRTHMGDLMRADILWFPALVFYGLFVLALLIFVVLPATGRGSLSIAVGLGALFGLVTYATYDLTSMAVLEGFSARLAVVDMVWGTILSTVVSVAGYLVLSRLAS